MNDDRGHGAMPKLYGAPAYARPLSAGIETSSRPFDPDDLPIESQRTDIDRQLDEELGSSAYAPAATDSEPSSADTGDRSVETKGGFTFRLPGIKG